MNYIKYCVNLCEVIRIVNKIHMQIKCTLKILNAQ